RLVRRGHQPSRPVRGDPGGHRLRRLRRRRRRLRGLAIEHGSGQTRQGGDLAMTAPRRTPPKRVVVVGHGMAGHRFVEALLARDTAGGWDITVLSEEPRPAYDRVALSSVFDGADEASLRLPALDGARVGLRLGVRAESVD